MQVLLKMIMQILVTSAATYALVVMAIFLFQDKLLFFPQVAAISEPRVFPPTLEKVYLEIEKGVTLQGVKVRNRPVNAPVVIAFGGNGHNITQFLDDLSNTLANVNLVAFNYRSYGGSNGKPSAQNILNDTKVIHSWLRSEFPNSDIYSIGVSLGTAPATHMAIKEGVKGTMLIMPYDDLASVGADAYPWLPVRLLYKNNMSPIKMVEGLKTPIAIVTAGNDTVIRQVRSRNLADNVPNLLRYDTIDNTGHVTLLSDPRLELWLKDTLSTLSK